MSLSDFQLLSRLGEGAYSSVYKVRRLTDNKEYALKKVKLINLSDKEKQNALNQVRILASIHNPNIIAYKEAFLSDSGQSLCIVMEYANNGDLFQKICDHQKNGTYFNENTIWRIFIRMVRGLKSLHDLKIMHRDLKSANVFLNQDGTAKLGDMNVSKVAKKGLLYTQTGTPYYASPEVWRDQPYDIKSDIWSLGCVLYEMITLKPPFRAQDMQGLYKKVLRGHYPKIPSSFSVDLANVIKPMLQVSAHLRPSCDRILEYPAVQKRAAALFLEDEEVDQFENVLLKTIRIPKNMMYLTDRLPKPNYEEQAPNDASHLSLPSINPKHNSTSPGISYGMTGKSGSISPIRGMPKRKIGSKKKSIYTLKSRDLTPQPSSPSHLIIKRPEPIFQKSLDVSVENSRQIHGSKSQSPTAAKQRSIILDGESNRENNRRDVAASKGVVSDSGGTKDTPPLGTEKGTTETREGDHKRPAYSPHSVLSRGSNASSKKKQRPKHSDSNPKLSLIKQKTPDLAEERSKSQTPTGPVRSPAPGRRQTNGPNQNQQKEYVKKGSKASSNLQRISSIYQGNDAPLSSKMLLQNQPSGVGSISPIKKKPSMHKDYSKEKFEPYTPYPNLSHANSGVGLSYIPLKGKSGPQNLAETRLPKLPILRGHHLYEGKSAESTLPSRIIGGYKYSSPGPRMASISPLAKGHAGTPPERTNEIFANSNLIIGPAGSAHPKRNMDSKISILDRIKRQKGGLKARPLQLTKGSRNNALLPHLQPLSISPQPRKQNTTDISGTIGKRIASLDRGVRGEDSTAHYK